MQKLSTLALAGIAATALAGAAIAAGTSTKTMKVPLADGSTVTVEYAGDVAPKVTVIPPPANPWSIAFPDFAGLDRIFADFSRRHAEIIRRMETLSRQPLVTGAPGLNLASGDAALPGGSTSVSVVTVSNGSKSCTRTTEVVSQGPGKPPKVTSNISGDCESEVKGGTEPAALDHT